MAEGKIMQFSLTLHAITRSMRLFESLIWHVVRENYLYGIAIAFIGNELEEPDAQAAGGAICMGRIAPYLEYFV